MTNKTVTKRTLTTSALAILACIAMLIGTTFAWFTDTASTAVNKIVSGNLKVGLQYAIAWDADGNPTAWDDAEGKTLNFRTADGRTTNILWEPNCTYALPELRVVNGGKLALKYKIQITGIKGDAMLNDVVEWTINNADMGTEYHLLPEKVSDVITIKGHMDENANNDYQNRSITGIGITVLATQDTIESDSFNTDYDTLAEYPLYAMTPVEKDDDGLTTSAAKVVSEKKNADTGLPLATATAPVGTKMADGAKALELTIEDAKNPSNFTVDITQIAPKTLDISMKGLAADNNQLIKVEFYIEKGLSVVEINHNGRKMSRCSAMKWLDADQEFYYDTNTGLVTMLTKTFSPFTYTADKFYWDNHKASTYATPIDTDNKVITVATADELALFKYEVTDKKVNYSGYTLNITADLDLGDGFWRPIDPLNNVTINGNGHTIRNLLVRSSVAYGYGFAFIGNATGTVTIRDLTFDNANVAMTKSSKYQGNIGGIVMAYAYGTTTFDNVRVTNSTIGGYGKIGALLGMGAEPGMKVTFKDCVSENNTLIATYNVGGLAGNIQRKNGTDNTVIENCTVKDIHWVADPKGDYKNFEGVTAIFKSNDAADGTDVEKAITGTYWVFDGRYWGAYGDYYVSYGGEAYQPTISGETLKIANSEYPVF